MSEESERWERDDGIEFLEKIGLYTGMTVLDFGAGYGHYTIPAAKVVGRDGVIYAVEKDEEALNKLREKKSKRGFDQIEVIDSKGSLKIDINEEQMDFCLLYDILHYFDKDEREVLYGEIKQLLSDEGVLSIYPKHTEEDFAMGEFEYLTKDDVIEDVRDSVFVLKNKICCELIHDEEIMSGCVFNFQKPRQINKK